MTRYIANEANLKLIMNLLRDKSRNIQFEAFHVFKVRFSVGSVVTNYNDGIALGLCCESKEATTN
jgi:hypothetical protein